MKTKGAELDLRLQVVSGALPPDLYGHLFITSPIPYSDGSHVFNGEGMLYRLDFGEADVAFKSRLLRTPCYFADQATHGTDYAFNNAGLARVSGTLGFRSMPNTAPVWFGSGRLLCAVDAARPYEVDPLTMQLLGPMGGLDEWTGALPPGLIRGPFQPIFSLAHPFFDEHTSEVFAVNYTLPFDGFTPVTALKRWDGSGRLETFELVDAQGNPIQIEQSAHQIAVTREYLLVMETAFLAEAEQTFGQDVARPQNPNTVLYLVRRADLRDGSTVEAKKVVIPRESAHLVADYDDSSDRITIHVAHLMATDLSEWLGPDSRRFHDGQAVRADLRGLFTGGVDRNALGRYVIDAKCGKVVDSKWITDDALCWATLFYNHKGQMAHDRFANLYYASFGFTSENLTQRAVELYRDYPHRQVSIDQLPLDGKPPNLFRLDVRAMEIADGYMFPPGRMPSSPQFVPREKSGDDTDGYMVCTVVSDDDRTPGSNGDEFWVFDASDLAQGPVCRLAAPELDFAFTIHSTWMPSLAARDSDYVVRPRRDYEAAVAQLDPEVGRLFEDEVYPQGNRIKS